MAAAFWAMVGLASAIAVATLWDLIRTSRRKARRAERSRKRRAHQWAWERLVWRRRHLRLTDRRSHDPLG